MARQTITQYEIDCILEFYPRDTYRIDLSGFNLEGLDLENANLHKANLVNTNLYKANLGNANLYKANLCKANLERANLEQANLYTADLENAIVAYANLVDANLYNANLVDANLYKADLHNTILEKANLYNACLTHTNLRNVDLTDVTMNWRSHELIAQKLRSSVTYKMTYSDNFEKLAIPGIVLQNRHLCWEELAEVIIPNIADETKEWVLSTMTSWIKKGDRLPEIIKQYIQK